MMSSFFLSQFIHDDLQQLTGNLRKVIVGQETLIDELITAVFAGGHVLLEGLPGLGKTHLVKALAASVALPLARIQCTPDHCFFDFDGLPVGGERQIAPYDPRMQPIPYIEGVELNGRLMLILSCKNYMSFWGYGGEVNKNRFETY